MSQKLDFNKFKLAIQVQFARLVKLGLFRVSLDKGTLYARYQEAWPEGQNEIHKTRREHECNCCHSFIRSVGNVAAINEDGELETIWDIKCDEPVYQIVADAMADFVSHHPIEHIFLSEDKTAGTDHSKWLDGEEVKRWDHFFVNIPKEYVKHRDNIGPTLSEKRADYDVLKRGLSELSLTAIDTVLELILQNSLYNAKQKLASLQAFKKIWLDFHKIPESKPSARSYFVWTTVIKPETYVGIARMRNSSLGTLLVDLSEGKELEDAVRAYEKVVAPENYKRPTSLVTESMVEAARNKVAELGLTSALSRRYATIDDISANNVLFINRELQQPVAVSGSDPFSSVPTKTKATTYDKTEDVSVDTFLRDILPTCTMIEALLENRHTANLVSLLAPTDPTSEKLFKWDNGFSWSYNGEIADSSLKKEVAARGGRVDGVFRFSHSWNHPGRRNGSLMDLHVFMPNSNVQPTSGVHDTYGTGRRVGWNHRKDIMSGGVQDVDYTKIAPEDFIPVENITFPTLDKMPEGRYICKVHNWSLRNPTTSGFQAELEVGGNLYQYDYPKKMDEKEWVVVAEVTLSKGEFTVIHHLKPTTISGNVWGLDTQKFHKVSSIMLSPNYWDGKTIGNQHTMLMLEGCVNPEEGRGFYNEFLRGDLEQHRKVFEMLGSNFKAPKSDRQLSGLGFSSTQKNNVVLRLTGAFTRIVKVQF